MNDLFINTTFYYVLAIIVYVYLCIRSVLLLSPVARNFTLELIAKLRAKIPKNEVIDKANAYSKKYFLIPAGDVLGMIFKFIRYLSDNLYKGEVYFTANILPEIIEPVNYVSLILRKCYTNSQTAVLTITALFFVVFYFILSIF